MQQCYPYNLRGLKPHTHWLFPRVSQSGRLLGAELERVPLPPSSGCWQNSVPSMPERGNSFPCWCCWRLCRLLAEAFLPGEPPSFPALSLPSPCPQPPPGSCVLTASPQGDSCKPGTLLSRNVAPFSCAQSPLLKASHSLALSQGGDHSSSQGPLGPQEWPRVTRQWPCATRQWLDIAYFHSYLLGPIRRREACPPSFWQNAVCGVWLCQPLTLDPGPCYEGFLES